MTTAVAAGALRTRDVRHGQVGDSVPRLGAMWPDGYPDFPMDQRLEQAPGRVTISCLVSDLMFTWQPREAGSGTHIAVTIELPEREAHRTATQEQLVEWSLATLARLAAMG